MAQHTGIARSAIMTNASSPDHSRNRNPGNTNGNMSNDKPKAEKDANLMPPPKTVAGRALGNELHSDSSHKESKDGVGMALTDTPISTAPTSPQL